MPAARRGNLSQPMLLQDSGLQLQYLFRFRNGAEKWPEFDPNQGKGEVSCSQCLK